MRAVEKKLKKEADRLHAEILQRNEPQYKQFIAEKYGDSESPAPVKVKRAISPKLLIGVAALLVILVSVSLWIAFASDGNGDDSPGKDYQKKDEIYQVADLSQLAQDTQCIAFEINETFVTGISFAYDSVTGDGLYYMISIADEDAFLAARLFIVTNIYYTLNFYLPEELNTTQINGFIVEYAETTTDEGGIFMTESKARITTDKETVYVDYSGYSLDEQSGFLDWLEGMLKIK